MFANLSIHARLNLLAGIVIVGNLVIAVAIWAYVDRFADNFTEYSQVGTPIQHYALMIERERNDASRTTRSIFLGEDFEKNLTSLVELEKAVGEHFSGMTASIEQLKIYRPATAAVLMQQLEESRTDAKAFFDEGQRIVRGLATVERTPELLRARWLEYRPIVSPLSTRARASSQALEERVEALLAEISAEAMESKSILHTVQIVANGLVTVIGQLLIFLISGSIRRPLDHLRSTIREIEVDSDLRRRVKHFSSDEMGVVAHSLNAMMDKFQESMVRVASSANALAQSSSGVATTANQVLRSTHQQEAEISQVAAAMHEMAASIQEVAQNARHAAESTSTAEVRAMNGREVVSQSGNAIQSLAGEIEQAADVIHQLENDGNRIGMVVEVIRGIAEQTNLLALNAAIEAARAGEQGRGFAVVADEVRNLASKTQASTQEIQSMIEGLQLRTHQAASVMQIGQERARVSVEHSIRAGEALLAITQAIKSINDMTSQIAHATVQQSQVAEEISRSVTNISTLSHGAADDVKQAVGSSAELAKYADNLQGLVRQFKV